MLLGFLLWFDLALGIQEYYETYSREYAHAPIYLSIEVHAENDYLDLYGSYENEMEYFRDFMFSPLNDYFIVGASISVGQFSINYEHMCQHPVHTSGMNLIGEYGGYNTVFVKLSTEEK